MAVRMSCMNATWTFCTSVVRRVTSEELENWSMVANENVWMFSNMSRRRFLAKPHEALEQVTPAAAPNASDTSAMAASARP